jgi:outer membrane protein OmpA-like peptidoglycan-associated protein/curli biogenesis system outer membrane secretion channel CsgG
MHSTVVIAAALLLTTPSLASAKGREEKAPKPRLAVLDFPAASGAWGCPGWGNSERRMAGVLRDLFTTEIGESADGEIRLVERERLETVRGELKLQQGGEVDPATAQQAGKLLGVRYMLTGKMTRFSCKKSGASTGWGVGALVGKATGSPLAGKVAGSAQTKSVSFEGRLDLRLIDTKTGEILGTFKDEEETSDLSVKVAGGGNDVAYDDGLANDVFEPIAKRQASKIVKKLLKVHAENLDDEEEAVAAEEEAEPTRSGTRVAAAGEAGEGDGGSRSSGKATAPRAEAQSGGGAGGLQGEIYSPRFDFVPGDKVLFFDDFSDTEPGDYPARWTVAEYKGQMEVVDFQGKRWLKAIKPASGNMRCAGAFLRVDLAKKLPEKFTIEFDVPSSGDFIVSISDKYWFTGQDGVGFGPNFIQTRHAKDNGLSGPRGPLRHVSIAVSGTNLKVYFDDERVLLDPEGVPSAAGKPKYVPASVGIAARPDGDATHFWNTCSAPPRDDLMFTNFKLAEGGKDYAKDLAVSGRIVTHGITFDSGSDRIRPESGPTLRKILKLLQDDSALAFEVQGHTDNQGGDKVNGPLSERRAAAVKGWLVSQGIEDGRLTTKGLGSTKPLEANETPEARANNRRVEFVRLGG